jgi:signal transduction histidine kinase
LNLLALASETIGTSLDFHNTAQHSCRIFVPHISAWSSLFIMNDDSPDLHFVHGTHRHPEEERKLHQQFSARAKIFAGKNDVQSSLRDGRVTISSSSESWFGEKYMAHLPLIQRSQVLGVITLGSENEFSPFDLQIAEEISRRAGAALDNARAYQKVVAYESMLIHSKQQAEQANREKSTFLANMSHEIRTPISAIMGFADLLMLPHQSEAERLQWSQRIKHNGQHLLRLINDILNLAKVESGQFNIENNHMDFLEFIKDIEITNKSFARDKGLQFEISLDSEVPAQFISDSTRLRQILNNLIGNAIKFTETGHIHVRTGFMKSAGYLYFDVEDSGPGLTEKESSVIFQPFVQANTAHSKKFGGTGLGLALSMKLARMLGGDLELVSSQPGKGSKFRVLIEPQVEPGTTFISALSSASVHSNAAQTSNLLLAGKKILVVDDSRDNQYLMKKILSLKGAEITIAESGEEVLQIQDFSKFDVILMDIQMPGIDGNETTTELRKRGITKPIVAFTANALPHDRELSLKAGCNRHVTKPVDQTELMQVLMELIG